MVDFRNGVLPNELFLGDFGSEIARARAHVAVGQLEPGPGEGIRELLGVVAEPLGDLVVHGVHPQCEVRRGHDGGDLFRRIVGGGREMLLIRIDRDPLPGACRAFDQIPVVVEEHVEVAHIPLGRPGRPGPFEAAADRISALAAPETALPAEALLLYWGAFRFGTDMGRGRRAMAFSESVAAGDQGNGLLVVHGHAREGLPNVSGGSERIRYAVGPLRVHVDQAHLHGSQGILKIAVARVPLVAKPLAFSPPIDVLFAPRYPRGRHRSRRSSGPWIDGAIAREDHKVGPRDLPPVLLLDRPE